MRYRLKIKKTLLIFYSVTITSSNIFFNSSATIDDKKPIGISSTTPELSNRPLVITNQPSRASYIKRNINMPPPSKLITLDKSGDYILMGAASSTLNPQGTNELIVNAKDNIVIAGVGEYNITLDNVNIDIKDKEIPIEILNEATVNLILKGRNTLRSKARYGIFSAYSELRITECSEGSSIDIRDQKNGIYVGKSIKINSGTINLDNKETGMSADYIEVNGGATNSSGQTTGMDSHYLIINGGIINSNGGINGIDCSQLEISDGIINSTGGGHGICVGNRLELNGGKVTASGGENGISVNNVKMNGGEINSISKGDGVKVWDSMEVNRGVVDLYGGKSGICIHDDLEINGGSFTSTGKKNGISVKSLSISGGIVSSTGDKNGICVVDDLVTNGGSLTASGGTLANNLEINGGSVNTSSIRANITITGGELLTKNINGVIWNHKTIKKTEKIFGVFDDEGSLIGCRKNSTDRYAKVTGYLAKFNDPTMNKSKYLLIKNGSINGITFTSGNCERVMKGGNNFITGSNHNNYNDLELFFE